MSNMDASDYQERRGRDDEDWGEPLPPRGVNKLDAMISVRFTSEEAELVRAAADAAGTSLSEFVRRSAMSSALGYQTHVVVSGYSMITSTAGLALPGGTATGSGRLKPILSGVA